MHNKLEELGPVINPATGLPMLEGMGIDVCGSPYGVDIHQPIWTPPTPTFDSWQPPFDDWQPNFGEF